MNVKIKEVNAGGVYLFFGWKRLDKALNHLKLYPLSAS